MPATDTSLTTVTRLLRDYRLYLPNPTFGNPPWATSACHILVMRLSPFHDVQRSTPHLFLAREAREALPGAFIDMAFLPRPSDAAVLAAAGLPLILGTQSHRDLRAFDLALEGVATPCQRSARGEAVSPKRELTRICKKVSIADRKPVSKIAIVCTADSQSALRHADPFVIYHPPDDSL